jgi:geranylgeranyl pyrophosphate synthase
MTDSGALVEALSPQLDAVESYVQTELFDATTFSLATPARTVLATDTVRLYPAVTLAVYEALSAPEQETTTLPMATALELLHGYRVAHTGRVSVAETPAAEQPLGDGLDRSTTVLVGDLLLSGAFELTTEPDLPPTQRLQCMERFVEAIRSLSEGAYRRATLREADDVTETEYLSSIRRTSGALCATAAGVGATLADVPDHQRTAASAYGQALGTAVGIHDETRALLGDSPLAIPSYNPPLLALPSIHARQRGVPVDRLLFMSDDRTRLAEALADAGSLSHAATTVGRFARQAREELETLPETADTASLRTVLSPWLE